MTAPADKPASLREILHGLFMTDPNYGSNEETVDEAIAAITALVPEKRPTMRKAIDRSPLTNQDIKRDGFNEAIDAIHRNFNGQPQGDKEE